MEKGSFGAQGSVLHAEKACHGAQRIEAYALVLAQRKGPADASTVDE